MKRRVFLSGLGLAGLSAVMPACQRGGPPLRIGGHGWPGYEFIFLAQREGWVSPQDTVLVETGAATESLHMLAAGEIDGAALTLDEVLRARDQGLPLTIVMVFDMSVGADVLLARADIESLAQLKGKRIGFEQNALGALMLQKMLKAAALQADDVQMVVTTFDRHVQVWQSGAVDALITFEPVASHLQEAGARRLFDSSDIPDTIFDVLAVTPTAAERHAEAIERLVAAHFRGLREFRKNPNDIAYRLAERFKLQPKEVVGAFKGLELPGEEANHKLLRAKEGGIASAAVELGVIMTQAGLLKKMPDDRPAIATERFISAPERR